MYISLTGNSDSKDVYIKRSYCKSNGKTATQIHKKTRKAEPTLRTVFWGLYITNKAMSI